MFVGPMLIHKRMDFRAYHFYASQQVPLCPGLCSLKSFSTDEGKALFSAFSTVFPNATHLRCFNHFKHNIEDRLKEFNCDNNSQKEILADIMGTVCT